jgi:hypothetical protein
MAAMLVLTNGRIWTGDPSRPFAEALAIDRNRIVAARVKVDFTIFDGGITYKRN